MAIDVGVQGEIASAEFIVPVLDVPSLGRRIHWQLQRFSAWQVVDEEWCTI
ncbi:MAG: hypothetical protein JW819_08940 [Candidatus Krumholzibacteriota bacterium]|nr:hypothetical protein [Candidatus Krumholzibacteriota bacterium]